ncbi:MAG: PQQ-binding-like beta-propeller repeat protein [Chloroflexi bacterium]|nr:PQQ-binding-like beta-propeller repeat protein [Chloroflexota bacterium]
MHHITVFIIMVLTITGMVAGAGCSKDKTASTSLTAVEAIWPSFMGGPHHRGNSEFKGQGACDIKWRYQTGGPVVSSPVLAGSGKVYFGSNDYNIYAVAGQGEVIWKYKTGGEVISTPCILPDGGCAVGSADGNFYFMSKDGEFKFKFGTEDAVFSSPTLDKKGRVLFGSNDGTLYCISQDGKLIWKYKAGDSVISSPAITGEGNILFGAEDYYFYCLSPEGSLLWKVKTGLEVSGSASVSPENDIYWGSCDCQLYRISPEGAVTWKAPAYNVVVGTPATTAAGGTIYYPASWLDRPAASGSGVNSFPVLFAVNRHGTVLWSFKGRAGMSGSPLVDGQGNIYIMDDESVLHSFSSEGKQLWQKNLWGDKKTPPKFEVDTSLDIRASSPAMGRDGTIYVGSGDGCLYAIGRLR